MRAVPRHTEVKKYILERREALGGAVETRQGATVTNAKGGFGKE